MRRIPRKTLYVLLVAAATMAGAWTWRYGDPPLLTGLGDLTFDAYQRLKPRQPLGQPIRIVDIDESSIAEFGQWPWPRTRIAAMVDRLAELGAATIAFDIAFSEPDRTGPAAFLEILKESDKSGIDPEQEKLLEDAISALPDNDAVLAASIARAPAVIGFFSEPRTDAVLPRIKAGYAFLGEDPKPVLQPFTGSIMSLPVFQEAASGNGLMSLSEQRDDLVREAPMFVTDGANIYPALSIEALRVAQGAKSYVLKTTSASGEISAGRTGMTSFKVGQLTAPVDRSGRFRIYFATNDDRALYLSARDLLQRPIGETRALVEGHIVFVGSSATGLRDLRITPLGESVPGVYMHAQIADQILSGDFLQRPDWAKGAEMAAMFVIGAMILLVLPFLGAVASAAFGLAMMAAVAAGSWFAFSRWGLLIDPLFPAVSGAIIYLMTTILLFAFTEREKRFVRGAFQRYLAPDLLGKLERNPESLKLGGEIRDMTLMFMDIRGFTSISEGLDPQTLVTFLNKLLSPLTDAIQAHEGAIDKYIGDSIMAFWNAPLDVADHPRKAARAALDMMRALRELNARDEFGFHKPEIGLGDVQIGIGLNSGPGCVGNMGSSTRFDYSVIGDTVNVAARIESTTKPAGWPILLSETTAAACPDFAILRGGAMPLKGKSKPATLYALIGNETVAATPQWRELARLHQEFLEALDAGQDHRIEPAMRACLQASDLDLAAFYAALAASKLEQPARG